MDNRITNYKDTKHKIRYLWNQVQELEGLEGELFAIIDQIKSEISTIRKEIDGIINP